MARSKNRTVPAPQGATHPGAAQQAVPGKTNRQTDQARPGRLLVVDKEQGAPRGPVGPVASPAQLARHRQAGVLESTAAPVKVLGQCLEMFVAEAGKAVIDLVDLASDGPRARLHAQARRVEEMLGWLRETTVDLQEKVDRIHAGMAPTDTVELLREVLAVNALDDAWPGVEFEQQSAMPADALCSVRSATAVEIFYLALDLVARRIGGAGTVRVEVDPPVDGFVPHRFVGLGTEHPVSAPEQVESVRRLVLDEHGGRLRPIAEDGRTGLAIDLPMA